LHLVSILLRKEDQT